MDLIHTTQENDRKLLGLGNESSLRFSEPDLRSWDPLAQARAYVRDAAMRRAVKEAAMKGKCDERDEAVKAHGRIGRDGSIPEREKSRLQADLIRKVGDMLLDNKGQRIRDLAAGILTNKRVNILS